MDGHGTGGDINPLNPTTFSDQGQNNSTHGVQQQQDGGVMNPNNNNNSLPMARCNSLDDMDGIDWGDNAGQGDDLGLLFWDELGAGGGGSLSTNNIDYSLNSLNNILDPAIGGYPLIDGMGVQQQQQGQVQQQQQGIVNNDMTLMANLIDDAIGIQGQDQSGGGSALLGGMLSHMSSFNSIAPPLPPTATATTNTATGISFAEGQRDESTSQDFSNTAVPPSAEDNQPPRIEDGINQSQQVGVEEQKTTPATSALDSVAAASSPQGPVLNKPQDNESPPLADGTNFITASTIASAESQSFSSTVNNTANNNNAVQGQIHQTTGNAKWPSQQEQEQQQQPVVQQPPAQQAVQPAVQQQVQQPIQSTQQQLMMNAMLANPAQLQAINPQAYYLWLCQQAQQPVQAPGIIQSQDIASSTAAAATVVQQPTVAISQLMLQLQAQQQQASQQQIQQSRLLQASQALAVHQSQLQQAAQLQQQAAAAHRQVPQAAIPTSSTTMGNDYKPVSSIPQKKKKTATIVHTADPSAAQRRMSRGSVGSYQPRAVTATPHHTAQNNNAASSSIIPHAAPSAVGMAQPTIKFPMVSASDTDATLAQPPPKKKTKRGSGVLSSSAGEYSTADEGLTPEQRRIKHNRERNREHAKNTRLRKKEYVERLKMSVDELCRERDNLVSERATAASLMVEVHSKRVDVLRSFFALRASYSVSQRRELWSSILDESSFTCRLPVTPYQSFPSSEVQVSNCQRTIAGVDSMIGDAAANYVFLDSIVDRGQYPDGKIKFQYTLVTEESVVSGNQLMARWAMSTLNAKKCGANTELHQRGMLICKFNSAHKIVNLEIMFDVMAFMLQVKMAMGYNNFNDVVIPNTVQTCGQKVYDYPMVMTLANRPYTIVQVNERWENLTGYKKHEVVGKRSCSILQQSNGSSDASASSRSRNRKDMNQLMGPVLFQRPSCAMVVNYTKTGRRFRQYVTIYPLSTDSNVTHYFGLTTFVQWLDQNDENKDQTTAKKPSPPQQATKNTNNTKDGSSQESSSSTSINPNSTSSSNNTISSTDAVAPSNLKRKKPSK